MSKPFGRGRAGGAGPDDDHRWRRFRRRRWRRARLLRSYDHAIAAPLDFIARDRIQRRRAHGIARAQLKARMMPRAAQRLANDEAFREGTTIVRARRSQGVNVGSDAYQHDRLAPRMPDKRDILGQIGYREPDSQIGTGEL